MATLPRQLHQDASVRSAIRRRASTVEGAESDQLDVRGLTPLLAGGIAAWESAKLPLEADAAN